MTQRNQPIESHAALSDKRIVVLGGSSGIGLAVAQQAGGSKGNGNHRIEQRRPG